MRASPLLVFIVGIAAGALGYAVVERLQAPPPVDLESVKATDTAFSGVSEMEGVKEAFTRYAMEDVVFLPSGGHPIAGREALAASFNDFPAGAKLTWVPAGGGISRVNDLAYTWGHFTTTFAEGEPHYGKYLTVWRRQTDGSWRVEADTGNASPAPAAP